MSDSTITGGTSPSHFARPEIKLLLLAARTRMDAERAAQVRELVAAGLDWDYLLRTARWHGVVPLLYTQLNSVCPQLVPSEQLARLKEQFQRNTARNLFLTAELGTVLKTLERGGVRAIAYKGPALAVTAYGDVRLRRFVDLDVMVQKRDVLRSKELLLAEGYVPQPQLTDAQQEVMLRTQHNLPFAREGGRVLIELHWDVAARHFSFALDPERMWERLETVKVGGLTVQTFAPEDLLLSLCVHGSKHYWGRLAWLCDINEIIAARERLDWAQVVRQAKAAGDERMLFLGLFLARELLGAEIPLEVRQEFERDRAVLVLAAQAKAHLFDEPGTSSGNLQGLLFHLRARRRLRDKLRYVRFAFAPTDADLVLLPLPARLSFLYYLLRPLRLAIKSGEPK